MTPSPPIRVRVERRIATSAERIYDAWLDPALIARFLFATPNGRMRSVDIDARIGGRFRIVETRNGEDAEHFGVWLELERPHRLVFAFSIERADPDGDRVSVDIIEEGDACRVILTHDMDPAWADYADKTQAGWMHILDGLDATLDTHAPRSTDMNSSLAELIAPETVRIERLLPGPIERVWAYLTESDLRGRWLATGEMDLRVGGAVHLHWHHVDLSPDKAPAPERFRQYDEGVSMTSRITRCEPPHALAYTWGDDSAEVLFELTPRGDHVHLVVTHSGMPTHEGRTSVATGWHAHLAVLIDVLEGRAPRNFWSLFEPLEAACAERMRSAD